MRVVKKKGVRSELDKYQGKWVAVTEDEKVIAVGKSLEEILPFVKEGGKGKAYALFVPHKKGQIQI